MTENKEEISKWQQVYWRVKLLLLGLPLAYFLTRLLIAMQGDLTLGYPAASYLVWAAFAMWLVIWSALSWALIIPRLAAERRRRASRLIQIGLTLFGLLSVVALFPALLLLHISLGTPAVDPQACPATPWSISWASCHGRSYSFGYEARRYYVARAEAPPEFCAYLGQRDADPDPMDPSGAAPGFRNCRVNMPEHWQRTECEPLPNAPEDICLLCYFDSEEEQYYHELRTDKACQQVVLREQINAPAELSELSGALFDVE